MLKKVWFAGLLALVLVVSVVGAALAAPSQDTTADPPGPQGRGQRPPHVIGEISEIGADSLTLELRLSAELTVEVQEFTSYLGTLESFDDLEVGMVVAVIGQRSGEGSFIARAIVSQEDLPLGTRIMGEVIAVTSSSLTIQTRKGETFTYTVNADTEFLSRENAVTELADIEEGDHVMILYEQASNGTLTANVIAVGAGPQEGPPPAN